MQISSSCRTGFHFAEAYAAAAQEQQGNQPLLSRMPTENELGGLVSSLVYALKKLEDVRDMVQQNRLQTERARENGGRDPDDGDVAMYGDGMKAPSYSMHEVKKRRGVRLPSHSRVRAHAQDTDKPSSARLLLGGATAATGSTRRNGGVAPTAQEPSAMLAGFTTPSSSASDSSTKEPSGRSRRTSENEPHRFAKTTTTIAGRPIDAGDARPILFRFSQQEKTHNPAPPIVDWSLTFGIPRGLERH